MKRITAAAQPGPPAPGARPAMRTGTGMFLIASGAVLLFALRAGSLHWLNLHVVGVILILTGTLWLMLPRLTHTPRGGDRLSRWVRPNQTWDPGRAPAAPGQRGYDNHPARALDQRRRR